MVMVRPLQASDEAVWRRLWGAYNVFYEVDVPEEVTASTFARLLDPAIGDMGCFIATQDGADTPIGFATWIEHWGTWSVGRRYYLEDLYVDETVRSQGAGRALMDAVIARAKKNGIARVYWHTMHDNDRARTLYDTYVEVSGSVRYNLDLDGPA